LRFNDLKKELATKIHMMIIHSKVSGIRCIKGIDEATFDEMNSMYLWTKRGDPVENILWKKMEEKAIKFENMEFMALLSIYQLDNLCNCGSRCHTKEESEKLKKRFSGTKNRLFEKFLEMNLNIGQCTELLHSLLLCPDVEGCRDLKKAIFQRSFQNVTENDDWSALLAMALVEKQRETANSADPDIIDIKPIGITQDDNMLLTI
jgi:hypothetical protein